MTGSPAGPPPRSPPPSAEAGFDTALATLHALAAALDALPISLPDGVPGREAAATRLSNGIPALAGEPLLATDTLVRNAIVVAEALSATDARPITEPIRRWLSALASGRQAAMRGRGRPLSAVEPLPDDSLDQLTFAVLAGWNEPVTALADGLGLDPDAMAIVLDHAARPALRAASAAVRPLVSGCAWERVGCPACGAPPALSVIHGKERERQLLCGRCTTAWAFPRVRCPACGERDHRRLTYLHAAGESEYRRVELCESCLGYVKSVAVLDPPDAGRLLELDLETAFLDFLALDAGYTRARTASHA